MCFCCCRKRAWAEGPEWEELFRCYDRVFELDWPADRSTVMVPTRFGLTHVSVAGDASAPPVLLLHGAGASSAMWGAMTCLLRSSYRVIVPDEVGEVGRSELDRMPKNAAEVVEWVREVLQGVGHRQVAVVGMSYGAWIASQVAAEAPELVSRLVLVSPAGVFAPLTLGFAARVIPAVLYPTESMIWRAMRYQVKSLDPLPAHVRDFIVASMRLPRLSFGQLPPPLPLPDATLRSIKAPTLLLVGAFERVTNPTAALARAKALVPGMTAETVADAGHMMTDERPDAVNARVLRFLRDGAEGDGPAETEITVEVRDDP